MISKSLLQNLSNREKKINQDGSLRVVLKSKLFNGDKNLKELKIKKLQLAKILHLKSFFKTQSKTQKKVKMKNLSKNKFCKKIKTKTLK